MFKKPVKIGAQNQLSGKDRKTMRNKLVSIFDEASVEKLLAVNDKIISCKVSGSKMLIYNGNDYPIFVDGTSKGDFFPSLYTAQAYEPLIKCMDINEGVESFIFNGANLMWPGVRNCSELGEFKKDEVVCIRSGKGEPIAIGAMGCSFKQFQEKSDINGVAVYILHYKTDKLWDMGPKTNPEVIVAAEKPQPKEEQKIQEQPKEEQKADKKDKKNKKKGEKEKQDKQDKQEKQEKAEKKEQKEEKKKPKKEKTPEKKKSESEEEDEDSDDGADDFMNMVHTGKKGVAPKEVKVQKKKQATFSDEQEDRKGKKKGGKKDQKKKGGKNKNKDSEDSEEEPVKQAPVKKEKKKKAQSSSQEEEQNSNGQEKVEDKPKSVISAKLMDQYLKQCFLNAIKLSKVQSELPIDSGRFYMDFMLLARPEGVKLEVKDSTYKKLGKFYDDMAKQKFIQFKHSKDKKGQQGPTINKIFWENKQLSNYQPTVFKMSEKDVEQKQEAISGKKKLVLNKNFMMESSYKPHTQLIRNLYGKKVNYMPTQQEEIQMKKQEEEIKNLPSHYPEHEMKSIIEKYINEIAQGKSKKQKTQKMIAINYKANPFLAELLKKQIQTFEENQGGDDDFSDDDEEPEDKKKKEKEKNKGRVFRIDRGTLLNKILKKCSPSYHIIDKQNEIDAFYEGAFKGIQLIAEKTNNKNITKIIGLETFIVPKKQADEQINGFANHLQQKFACSVNIQNLPGKNAGKQIIVHGNFITDLQEMLTGQYELNEAYIATQNKLEKKKKK